VLGWVEDSVTATTTAGSALKLELTFNFDVGDNYRQHPLVNIDSRDPV
jgi:hypothetical protein